MEEEKLWYFEETLGRWKQRGRSVPQEQGRPSLADGGGNRPVGGIGGARTVVRGWRVKGRDVLGPVDTAESPERASRVARKFVRMRIYRRARGFKRRNRGSVEGGFCPFCLPILRFTTSLSSFSRPSYTAPRNSMLFVSLGVSCFLLSSSSSSPVLFASTVCGGD